MTVLTWDLNLWTWTESRYETINNHLIFYNMLTDSIIKNINIRTCNLFIRHLFIEDYVYVLENQLNFEDTVIVKSPNKLEFKETDFLKYDKEVFIAESVLHINSRVEKQLDLISEYNSNENIDSRKFQTLLDDFHDTLNLLDKDCKYILNQSNLINDRFSQRIKDEILSVLDRIHYHFFIKKELTIEQTNDYNIFEVLENLILIFFWKPSEMANQKPVIQRNDSLVCSPESNSSFASSYMTNNSLGVTTFECMSQLSSGSSEIIGAGGIPENASTLSWSDEIAVKKLSKSTSFRLIQEVYFEIMEQSKEIGTTLKEMLDLWNNSKNQLTMVSFISTEIYKKAQEQIITLFQVSKDYFQELMTLNSMSERYQDLVECSDQLYLKAKLVFPLSGCKSDFDISCNNPSELITNIITSLNEFIKICNVCSPWSTSNNENNLTSSSFNSNGSSGKSSPISVDISSQGSFEGCSQLRQRSFSTVANGSPLGNSTRRINHINFAASQYLLNNQSCSSATSSSSINYQTLKNISSSGSAESTPTFQFELTSTMDLLSSLLKEKEDSGKIIKSKSDGNIALGRPSNYEDTKIPYSIEQFLVCYPEVTQETMDQTIWYEQEKISENVYYEDENKKGNSTPGIKSIKYASLNQLIIKLTNESNSELKFSKTFITTYRSFTSSNILLMKLIQRYFIPNINNSPPFNFINKIQIPIQLRVLNVIRMWVEQYPNDFTPPLIEKLSSFLTCTRRNGHGQYSDLILKKFNSKKKDRLELPTYQPPKPKIFWMKYSSEYIFCLSSTDVAEQLTLIDFDTYKSIEEIELLNQAWSKDQKNTPNITAMSTRFNSVSAFVSWSILREADIKVRSKMMAKFIKICIALSKLNNFNGLYSVLAGLNSSSIYRLHHTKSLIPKTYFKKYEHLCKFLDNNKSQKVYREAIHSTCPPLIPYVGIYLTDLTFIEDGNKDEVKGLINFKKRELIFSTIMEIQQYQQQPYNIKPKPNIIQFLFELPSIDDKKKFEDQLHEQSHLIEPKNLSKAELLLRSGYKK
ncbi:hypothetical protein CYY_008127 [Polysphondylium violaceum]|uniref:Ras guanine nucleotide exchange factor n=1 Tax=Polysphondylium violaceum TaxID=133409 RepID=A0A8J4PP29_9MYCE|nr:hypothetical protein CYY_008127 [Polysphondylium violaceum]